MLDGRCCATGLRDDRSRRAHLRDVVRERSRYGLRCYVDIGTRESKADEDNRIDIENVRLAAAALREQGAEVVPVIEPDADHTERAWRRRFPAALAWFLDPSRRPAE
jgi:hypothetical protein